MHAHTQKSKYSSMDNLIGEFTTRTSLVFLVFVSGKSHGGADDMVFSI